MPDAPSLDWLRKQAKRRLTVDGQLFNAARNGDVGALAALLDKHPDKLHVRQGPYEGTLLHAAATNGHFSTVDLLLTRGLDVNVRETGDQGDFAVLSSRGDVAEVALGTGEPMECDGDPLFRRQ